MHDFHDQTHICGIVGTVADASLTDWITALGTAGGFVAAGAGVTYDLYRRRTSERYAQARLVDAWLGSEEFGERVFANVERATMSLTGYVSNASRAAVRDVRFEIRPNPSAEQPLFAYFQASVGTVPPTPDGRPFPWRSELIAGVGYAPDADFRRSSLRGYILWLRFTDTTGQRWVRHPDGKLELTTIEREAAVQAAEQERLFPGLADALRDSPSPTPEQALDKFREQRNSGFRLAPPTKGVVEKNDASSPVNSWPEAVEAFAFGAGLVTTPGRATRSIYGEGHGSL
jgi:hypothetical protein